MGTPWNALAGQFWKHRKADIYILAITILFASEVAKNVRFWVQKHGTVDPRIQKQRPPFVPNNDFKWHPILQPKQFEYWMSVMRYIVWGKKDSSKIFWPSLQEIPGLPISNILWHLDNNERSADVDCDAWQPWCNVPTVFGNSIATFGIYIPVHLVKYFRHQGF